MSVLEAQKLSQAELDEKPWKYIGYPGFVSYVSSDDDNLVLRRFDRLHSRLLLRTQDTLVGLEEELDILDNRLSLRAAADVDNGSFRNDNTDRKQILDKIKTELNDYDKLLCHYIQLKAKAAAPKTNVRNMTKWLANCNHPIKEEEIAFLSSLDMISIGSFQKTPVRRLFEQNVLAPASQLIGFLHGVTRQGGAVEGSGLRTTIQGSDERVDIASTISLFVVALTMLIAPLWILAVLDNIFRKLTVITLFSTGFLAVMNWGTSASPFEIFAATAGYCAVLVVFLQLGTPPT